MASAGLQGINDQSKQRVYLVALDQHGRQWGGSIELKTRHFTGKLEYIAHIQPEKGNPNQYVPRHVLPPWLPEQTYIKPVEGEFNRVRIDYETLLAHARDAEREYRRKAMQEGLRVHGEAYDPEKPVTREVRDIVGPPPLSPHVVIAAMQGNPWIIGQTKEPDARLEQFLVRQTVRARDMDLSGYDYGTLVPRGSKPPVVVDDQPETETWPKSRGGGYWEFSDGTRQKLTTEMAMAFQADIDEKAAVTT